MTPLPPLLAPLAFLVGSWEGANWSVGGSPACAEHWARVGDELHGVAFVDRTFELMQVEVVEESVRYVVRPGGGPAVAFPLVSATDEVVSFANPAHDAPRIVEYHRRKEKLRTRIGDAERMEWVCSLRREEPGATVEVLAADRAREAGRTAVLSGVSPSGVLAFTIGTWSSPNGETGSYTTVWQREDDGGWVLFYEAGEGSGPPASLGPEDVSEGEQRLRPERDRHLEHPAPQERGEEEPGEDLRDVDRLRLLHLLDRAQHARHGPDHHRHHEQGTAQQKRRPKRGLAERGGEFGGHGRSLRPVSSVTGGPS
jgi:hypothetical protein